MVAAISFAAPANLKAQSVDFSGRTITALVGYAAGGAVDVFARLVANHVGAHIPGKPRIIVENKPGAGGVVAANYLYNVARRDGSVFLVTISPFTNQFISAGKVGFDTSKFYWLGALDYSNTMYVRSDLGVRTSADLAKAKQQIVVGGLTNYSPRDLHMRAFLEAAGHKNYKYVSGYQGTLPIRIALLRGEVNFNDESALTMITDLAPYIKDGTIVPLVQSGVLHDGRKVRDPQLPHVPTAHEAVVALRGEVFRKSVEYRAFDLVASMISLGRGIFMPPGVEPAVAATLRAAFGKLNDDPEFQKSAAKLTGGPKMELTDGAIAQTFAKNFTALAASDQAALQYLKNMAMGRDR
jgi:tripartite-type tricarboxylate transporter receptor subunit TctC